MMLASTEELQVTFNDNTQGTTVMYGASGGSVKRRSMNEDIVTSA